MRHLTRLSAHPKHRLLLLLHVVVMLAFVLAACGGQPASQNTEPTTAPAAGGESTGGEAAATAAPSGGETTTEGGLAGQETLLALTDPQDDVPTAFNEAPMLAEMVAAGDLPPVEERLPVAADIEVVPVVEQIGEYGGTWREVHAAPDMGSLKMIVAYEPPVRWKPDYSGYEPGLAKSVEWSEDGKTITFRFREGVKWSDGTPFTTADLDFWWNKLAKNEEYKVVQVPWWARNADGSDAVMTFPDEYTWVIEYTEAQWLLPYSLAQGFWEWSEPGNPLKPKHYLEQFLPENGGTWEDMEAKSKWWENPDFPTVFAWHVVDFQAGSRVVFERNPYYWKVDAEGNQLPYIDRIESEEVPDPQVRILNLTQGKYDASFRGVDDPNQIPLLAEKAEASGYRLAEGWMNGAGGWPCWIVNQNFLAAQGQPNDEAANEVRALLRDPKFRQAVSHAIDRQRVIDTAWGGIGTPQQATISPQSWHFQGPEGEALFQEWANAYAEYNPDTANALLDEVMGPAGSNGFRTLKSGAPFQLVLDINDWGTEAVQVAAATTLEGNLEAVGVDVLQNNLIGSPDADLRQKQGLYMMRACHASELDLVTYPSWIMPNNNERAWPLVGRWYQTGGAEGEAPEPGGVEERLYNIYRRALSEPDLQKRLDIINEAIRIHIDEGPFIIGAAGDQPMPVVIKNNFRNVPESGVLGPWAPGSPGNVHPEQFFFSSGS